MNISRIMLAFVLLASVCVRAQTVTNSPVAPTNSIDVTKAPYGASVNATSAANTTAIQAAINDAVTQQRQLYIPAPLGGGCYNYTAPLTISGNLSVVGDWVAGNWPGAAQINIPSGTPSLLGSVLCPTSNGSDGIDISGTALTVNFSNIGLLFQTPFTGTGHGISYRPGNNVQGLSGAVWSNVFVYGHDGNHYAATLQNFIYGYFANVNAFGGGLYNLTGTSTSQDFGNATFVQNYGNVAVAGSAQGINISSSSTSALNLLTFVRLQVNVNNTGIPNPPTSAQQIFVQDANTTSVVLAGGDLETNTSSALTAGKASGANDMGWQSLATTASVINAPDWSGLGLVFNPIRGSAFFNDTTSSGAVSNPISMVQYNGWHLSATSPTTYAVGATLVVGAPIASTNVSFSRTDAIYALGEIYTTGDLGSAGGIFVTGGGSIGGSLNLTGALTVSGVSTSGTIAGSVCMTSANLLLYESGATGCTISLAALKNIKGPMTEAEARATLEVLTPIDFSMKPRKGEKVDTAPRLGFTAENAHQANPRLSTYDGNGKLQGYDPNGIIAALVVQVKEQQRQIARLEKRLIH